MLRWLRVASTLTIVSVALEPRPAQAYWPVCDEGGPGSNSCSTSWENGSCQITCEVGSACCSVYNGCHCLFEM